MIERLLALSTAHMPDEKPYFGDDIGRPRISEHEYGYILFVNPQVDMGHIAGWLVPIMKCAIKLGCTLILFDADASKNPDFREYDW